MKYRTKREMEGVFMSDILDSIDDLVDDDELDYEEEFSFDEEAESLDTLLENEGDMSEQQAREITEAIRSAATATYILLAQAHEGKAFKALGYSTWADYVKEEFEISPQRSYQLLDLSRAINLIEDSAPEGTNVKLTEAQARDIKRELPKITEQIREATQNLEPEDAGAEVDRIIEEAREQKKADDKVIDEKEKKLAEADQEGYQRALEDVATQMLDADAPENMTSSADDEFLEVDVEGEGGVSPQDSMNLYNFVNAMTGIGSLPEPDDFMNIIPDSRFSEIYDQVLEAASWVNRLSTLMEMEVDNKN